MDGSRHDQRVIVRAQVQAVFICMCLAGLAHLNITLWADYAWMCLWAFILSEALRKKLDRYSVAMSDLREHLTEGRGGFVHWLLVTLKLLVPGSFLGRVWHNLNVGGGRSRFWRMRIIASEIRAEIERYFQDGVVTTVQDIGQYLVVTAVDNGLLAFCLYAAVRSRRTLTFVVDLCILVALCGLMAFVWAIIGAVRSRFAQSRALNSLRPLVQKVMRSWFVRKIVDIVLGPIYNVRGWDFISFISSRGTCSFFVIFGTLFCITFVTLFLIIGALYDLGSGSVQLCSYIRKASTVNNDTVVQMYESSRTYLELGYAKLQENYEAEEWWPVISGVRDSLVQQNEGIALLERAYGDLQGLYNESTWWPAAEQLHALLVPETERGAAQGGHGGEIAKYEYLGGGVDFTSILLAFQRMGDPVALGKTVVAGIWTGSGQMAGLLQLSSRGLWSVLTVLKTLSEWGLWGFMFLFFLFKMTAMETDFLHVVVRFVLPSGTEEENTAFTKQLRATFEAVFFLPFSLAFTKALYMLVIFDLLELARGLVGLFVGTPATLAVVNGKTMQTLLCFLLSLTQVFGSWVSVMVALPLWPMLQFEQIQRRAGWVTCLELLVVLFALFIGTTKIRDRLVTRETEDLPIVAWLVDFALVIGVTKFGMQGMLCGPMIVAVAGVVWQALVQSQEGRGASSALGSSRGRSRGRTRGRSRGRSPSPSPRRSQGRSPSPIPID
eukprot:COSAG02_NODE_7117_length_3176_cov_21.672977_1_plen_721_part_00